MAGGDPSGGMSLQPLKDDIYITDNGTMVRFTLPSLSADAIDRDGNMPLWKVSKLFECARVTAIFNPEFFLRKLAPPNGDITAMIILVNMDMERHLYSRIKSKGWHMPVDLVTTLAAFGRTTADYVTFVDDPEDHQRLASLRFKYATVSLAARKAVPIPDHIKNQVSSYLKPAYKVDEYKPVTRTLSAHSMSTTVQPSHIDRNNHLNQSVYLRMCVDCASEAAHNGEFRYFQRNMTSYNAKRLNALYRKECRLGEVVTVYCWQDTGNHLVIHCDIMKGDQMSFQCSVEYHPPDTAKL